MTITSLRRDLGRFVSWHRRGLAALCAGLAMMCLLAVASPPEPVTTRVMVAARDLTAGSVLTAGDLAARRYPVGLVPSRALTDTGDAVGRTLSAALSEGSPLTAGAVSGASSLAAPGERLVPFRLTDAALLHLVSVGDLVTVVATAGDGSAVTVAERVRVAALPSESSGSGFLDSGGTGAVIVVSCPPKTAVTLAGWAATSALGIAIG